MSLLSRHDTGREAFRSHKPANKIFAKAEPGNVVFTGSENNTESNTDTDPYATYARVHKGNNPDSQYGKKSVLERRGAISGKNSKRSVVNRSKYFLRQSPGINNMNAGGARKKTRKHKKESRTKTKSRTKKESRKLRKYRK
jgi:hypothetical protein